MHTYPTVNGTCDSTVWPLNGSTELFEEERPVHTTATIIIPKTPPAAYSNLRVSTGYT